MKLKVSVLVFSAFLFSTVASFGWGFTPHAVIAYLGYKYATPETKAKILPLLKESPSLPGQIKCYVTDNVQNPDDFIASAVAPWPDSLRYIPVEQWGQAGSFAQNFYANCHFIDTAFTYGDVRELDTPSAMDIVRNQVEQIDGATKDDLYYLYASCVKSLALSQCPADKDEITPDEQIFALRFLIHFSGDATQPLHMSDPMYELDDKNNDSFGGNTIYFDQDYPASKDGYSQNINELHELWDNPGDEFVPFISYEITDSEIYVDKKSAEFIKKTADSINNKYSPRRDEITQNKGYAENDLIFTWITDTYIQAVANVCKGLGPITSYASTASSNVNKHGNKCIKPIPNTSLYVGCSVIKMPTPEYLSSKRDVYELQIYKGAVRLSDLLNAIYDPERAPENFVEYVNQIRNDKNIQTVNQLCQVYY